MREKPQERAIPVRAHSYHDKQEQLSLEEMGDADTSQRGPFSLSPATMRLMGQETMSLRASQAGLLQKPMNPR